MSSSARSKLRYTYINDIFVGEGLVGLVVLGVLEEHLVHVGAGILVEFVAAAEDNESYFTVTQHRELVSLFHHTKLPLVKCDLKYKEKVNMRI